MLSACGRPLDLDDDVLQAVKELGAVRKKTAGQILSELARKALEPIRQYEFAMACRCCRSAPGAPRMTVEDVERMLDEESTPVALLDVNVLIALFDSVHSHHDLAHDWFADNHDARMGDLSADRERTSSHPWQPSAPGHLHSDQPAVRSSPPVLRQRASCVLAGDDFRSRRAHLRPHRGPRYRQVTDVDPLGLAVTHGGRLVTFDQSIPISISEGRDATVAGSHRRSPD